MRLCAVLSALLVLTFAGCNGEKTPRPKAAEAIQTVQVYAVKDAD